jgi:hypothetical protein
MQHPRTSLSRQEIAEIALLGLVTSPVVVALVLGALVYFRM